MRTPLVDVHAHLARPEVFNRARELIRDAVENNVRIIVVSVQNENELKNGLILRREHSSIIYLSLGQELSDFTIHTYEKFSKIIPKLVSSRDVVAIGEIGLDYSKVRDNILRNIARAIFEKWVELAEKLNLPVIVHSHKAYSDVLSILEKYSIKKAILHAYSGGIELARKAVDMGFYFSIPPSVMHSKQKQRLVQTVPLEHMLLESDTPELGPVFGQESKPSHVRIVAEKIAEIKGIDAEDVAYVTTRNFEILFNLRVMD
ncbi:MAG: TatD family hydrolase [Crenarchaeota archaeon]|nr:TatD family hydrolase [Thermoproteota archaeon]